MWKKQLPRSPSGHHEPLRGTFDPARKGIPEREWRALLSHSEEWTPQPGPLVVVAPHPDDEVLGAGGLVHSWAMAGHRVSVISVTDGEAADASRENLNLVRRSELRTALRTLSPQHVNVERLNIPDGKVSEHKNRLRDAVRERAPDRGTMIAPYERDGHPDHDAVGEVCLDIAHSHGIALARYPVWAWHHTDPSALAALRWGIFRLGVTARRAKTRAMQCFDSQLRPPRGLPIVPPHVLEYFERPYEAFVL
jgi:LmbE family N-acetylglucosaminyl deacetylase